MNTIDLLFGEETTVTFLCLINILLNLIVTHQNIDLLFHDTSIEFHSCFSPKLNTETKENENM